MSCKSGDQEDQQECYAVAIPVDFTTLSPNQLPPKAHAQASAPSVASSYAAVVAAEEDDELPQHYPANDGHRKPPSWSSAFIAMFGYHLLASLQSLVAIVTVFTLFCLAALLLPFCGIGLVVFRFLVMLVDALLVLEVRYNNWAFRLLRLPHLVAKVPQVDTKVVGQSGRACVNLKGLCSCHNWTKIVYFGVGKWCLFFFHVLAAVCSPVTTLTSLLVGYHGICPVASVASWLTRRMVKRSP